MEEKKKGVPPPKIEELNKEGVADFLKKFSEYFGDEFIGEGMGDVAAFKARGRKELKIPPSKGLSLEKCVEIAILRFVRD